MGSALVSVHGGERWRRFIVVRSCRCLLLSVVCCCPLFTAIHLRSWLLAWHLAMGDVDGGVVASVGRVCVQSWLMVGVGCFHRRWLSFAGSLCPLRVLLLWLGGCGVMLGGQEKIQYPKVTLDIN